jgi:pimeloyl-ACP methyl ester carboxylesterase
VPHREGIFVNQEGVSIRFEARDGVALHAIEWPSRSVDAEAEPTVLLHGGGANAHWWDHLALRLAQHGRVLALDFRGHGDSEHPSERRVGAFNDDLEALTEHLGREDVHLVGHSLGASVAYDHASRHPATRSAVLIDLALGGARGAGRRARLALALRRTYASREEAIARFRFLPESSEASEELRRAIAEHSVREERDGRFGYKFDGGWFGLPSRPRPDPSSVGCPVLLVRGAESHLLSRDAALAFVTALPRGQLAEIEGAGHHVQLDRPERLLAEIDRFRSGLDRS